MTGFKISGLLGARFVGPEQGGVAGGEEETTGLNSVIGGEEDLSGVKFN